MLLTTGEPTKMTLTIETRPQSAATTGKHPRLVSFENSNSWLKRHDSETTLIIQAGYRENPGPYAKHTNESPIVVTENSRPRWYGATACEGQHVTVHGRSKIETARDGFAACLQASDDGRDLIVVASHWDVTTLDSLKAALIGQYRVVRNGQEIACTVTQVLPVLEGMGSYHMIKQQLKPDSTLLLELGYGTCEEWLIDVTGELVDGKTVDQLGIFNLVNQISADPTVRALLSDNSGTVNLSALSHGLQQPTLGKISASTWAAMKAKYASDFLKTLQGRLKTQYATQSQTISNIVLTGGGAALLRSIQPKVDQVFIIPEKPQTASVVGSYAHQMSKVG
jgi:hypothetical protein